MEAKLTAQMEDYLETIGQICQQDGVARVKDIAARLDVTNASVVSAIKQLKKRGLVQQERYGYAQLTHRGQKRADAILHRHEVLTEFLERILGLDPDIASRDACVIEHSVSPETLRRLRAMNAFLKARTREARAWRRDFECFFRQLEAGT